MSDDIFKKSVQQDIFLRVLEEECDKQHGHRQPSYSKESDYYDGNFETILNAVNSYTRTISSNFNINMSNWIKASQLDKSVKELYYVVCENDTGTRTVQYQTQAMWVPELTVVDSDNIDEDISDYDEQADEFYVPEGWYEYMYEADFFYPIESSTTKVTHFMARMNMPCIYHIGLVAGTFGTMKHNKRMVRVVELINYNDIFHILRERGSEYRKIKKHLYDYDGLAFIKGRYQVEKLTETEAHLLEALNQTLLVCDLIKAFNVSDYKPVKHLVIDDFTPKE